MEKFENKWIRAAIPGLLIHCSIGTVYCWSLVKADIAEYIGRSKGEVEWAFSLAIFFLGMTAAFFGHVVEQDIKKSSFISAICFSVGMAGTGVCIYLKSLWGIYLFYGVIMGIGLGFGYLSPVKTLMLWFSKNKGLGTGLAVAGFGLAKFIASPIITGLMESVGLVTMFYILAGVYFVMMLVGHLLLRKPAGWVEPHEHTGFHASHIFKNPIFIGIWIMFYINISCGLAIISQEKDIMKAIGLSMGTIAIISSCSAIFNVAGRLGYSAFSDRLKDRNTIYKIILGLSIIAGVVIILTNSIDYAIVPICIVVVFLINANYGGGFSCVPTLLSDRFGMENVSKIHGFVLSAWAFAGLTGNQISSFIVTKTGSYKNVFYVTTIMYVVAMFSSIFLVKVDKVEKIG